MLLNILKNSTLKNCSSTDFINQFHYGSYESKKRKKKDFIESVENNAEILVTFLVENRRVKDSTLTSRSSLRVTSKKENIYI